MSKPEKQEDPEYRARSLALRLLARREHSRQELAMKLRQRRLPQEIIETVLDEYERENWLDDARFADVFARQRMDMGYGPVRIQAELQQRGIGQKPAALEEVTEEEWCAQAVKAREKRFGLQPVDDDLKLKMKQARFLSQRGYSGTQVEWALEQTAPVDDR